MYVQYVYALDGVAEFLPLLCGIMVCSNYTLDCGHLHFGLCATVGTAIVQLMVYVACSMNFQLQIFLSLECVYTPGR